MTKISDAAATKIALVMHESVRAWQKANDQAIAPAWSRAPKWMKDSSIEAVIERYGAEHHELAGRAKDMGSAAVFVLMMNVILVWALILGPRLLQG